MYPLKINDESKLSYSDFIFPVKDIDKNGFPIPSQEQLAKVYESIKKLNTGYFSHQNFLQERQDDQDFMMQDFQERAPSTQ